jgi:hypothetical protein
VDFEKVSNFLMLCHFWFRLRRVRNGESSMSEENYDPHSAPEPLLDRIPSGNYMVDGVGQPGVGYFARFAT